MQHPMLTIALRAARNAGDLVAKYYAVPDVLETSKKNSNSLSDNVNEAAERIIIDIIGKSYPRHEIITKKNNQNPSIIQGTQWIIDSLNGKHNFVKRLPHFSISIAVLIRGRTEVAVVYDPMRNELFTATRGQGAQLNGYRLRVSSATDLVSNILSANFPLQPKQLFTSYMEILGKLSSQFSEFRGTGSTALDLAYVAAGRIDGYFALALKPSAYVAGELLAREAGALVCDFSGGHDYIMEGNLIAGNPRTVKVILKNARNELNEALKRILK